MARRHTVAPKLLSAPEPNEAVRYAVRDLERKLEKAQKTLEEFAANLLKPGPSRTFGWGYDAVEAAVVKDLCGDLLRHLNEDTTTARFEVLLDTLRRRVQDKGRFPSQSSSTLSNLVSQTELSVTSALLEDFTMALKWEQSTRDAYVLQQWQLAGAP